MAEPKPQTYENHAKFVPTYHFVASGILLIFAAWSLVQLVRNPSLETAVTLLLAIALILMFLHLRFFPLAVQDRVIRLEMRLRLAEVLPEELRGRIGELRRGQLIALRFAGDDELPGLVREVLEGKLTGSGEIKKRIRNWQADHWRC